MTDRMACQQRELIDRRYRQRALLAYLLTMNVASPRKRPVLPLIRSLAVDVENELRDQFDSRINDSAL